MPSFFDVVAGYAAQDPDRLAMLTEHDGVRSYGQLTTRAGALAAGLHTEVGLQAGERVCIWAVNRPEWIETYLASAAAGYTTVAANPEWTDAEAAYVFNHSEAVVVVCDANLAERAVRLVADIPRMRAVVALTDDGVPAAEGSVSFEALVAGAPEDWRSALPTGEAPPPTFLMYTSGTTTGRPKAVMSKPTSGAAAADYKEMFGLNERDRAICITPFFHGNGFGAAISALGYGASFICTRRFSARRFWNLVDLYRPTYLWTLVPLVNILMGRPPCAREKAHNLRVLIVLGSGRAAEAMEERFATPVIDWYGMTEAGSGTYTRLDEERRPGSAGRPFPNSGMVIVDDEGEPVPTGVTGEVVFRRDVIGFNGYLNDAEATGSVLDDRYFHTGDLGYFDADGYFYFMDRKKDIVRRGGENISSMEVEAALRSHPAIAEGGVVGKPDPVLGERLVAFVVLSEGVDTLDADDVKAHVGGLLAHFKVPEELYVVDELPRTGTGKIEKFKLRQQLPTS